MKNFMHNVDFKHEQRVRQFLTSKKVASDHLNYANFNVYADIKHFLQTNLLSDRDRKRFAKFTRHWVIAHGEVSEKHLTTVKGMLKYYKVKEQNYFAKLKRQALRPNSIKV